MGFLIERLLALLLLILVFPVLLILLLITVIDLGANPIYSQLRTVDGTIIFRFYKIRSMKLNAPLVSSNDFVNGEKYITKWGRFIRTHSLDEILNLFCIVKGDMKFIGPRPVILSENILISMRSRHGIREIPGVTGFAQINGRDFVSLERKVFYEKVYSLKKRSITFRLYIILKTTQVVLSKIGVTH